jgi:hypothetical protein
MVNTISTTFLIPENLITVVQILNPSSSGQTIQQADSNFEAIAYNDYWCDTDPRFCNGIEVEKVEMQLITPVQSGVKNTIFYFDLTGEDALASPPYCIAGELAQSSAGVRAVVVPGSTCAPLDDGVWRNLQAEHNRTHQFRARALGTDGVWTNWVEINFYVNK